MSLQIDCPSGHPLKVPLKRAGHVVRCPVCDQRVEIPPLPAPNSVASAADQGLAAPHQVRRHRAASPAGTTPAQSVLDVRIDTSSSSARDKLRTTIEQAESRRDRERKGTLWALSIAAFGVVGLVATPAVVDLTATGRGTVPISADPWTFLTLLVALIQAAVAIYALRLPDWSTCWVASLVTTSVAAMYALGLALTMFANQENAVVRQLGLLDEMFRGAVQRWCFLVMCVMLILAYAYGRFSLRWYRADQQLRQSRSGPLVRRA